jgi:hypothetical protein
MNCRVLGPWGAVLHPGSRKHEQGWRDGWFRAGDDLNYFGIPVAAHPDLEIFMEEEL